MARRGKRKGKGRGVPTATRRGRPAAKATRAEPLELLLPPVFHVEPTPRRGVPKSEIRPRLTPQRTTASVGVLGKAKKTKQVPLGEGVQRTTLRKTLCEQRHARRETLFAKDRIGAGKSLKGPHRITWRSAIKC